MSIVAKNLVKRFGAFAALDGVSIEATGGELVALLGPSGSGKTTLLRIIAGLEMADEGTILFEGQDATARNARDRNVGFVFQHYALFKHMTVYENIAFGLRVRKKPRRNSRTPRSCSTWARLRKTASPGRSKSSPTPPPRAFKP